MVQAREDSGFIGVVSEEVERSGQIPHEITRGWNCQDLKID